MRINKCVQSSKTKLTQALGCQHKSEWFWWSFKCWVHAKRTLGNNSVPPPFNCLFPAFVFFPFGANYNNLVRGFIFTRLLAFPSIFGWTKYSSFASNSQLIIKNWIKTRMQLSIKWRCNIKFDDDFRSKSIAVEVH